MSMIFGFRKATNRKTECYWLSILGVEVMISYETPVAFIHASERLRMRNYWGPTTGRHMRETGVDEYPVAESREAFDAALDQAIVERIVRDRDIVKKILTGAVTAKLVEGEDVLG